MTKTTDQLAALSTMAPAGMTERVLKATNTGRFYDTIAGPTGILLVGWSSDGIYGIDP